ncbi:AbrB family transcriptional regulator [Christensenellaceae bacterium]|nr:AbrB family transcriptional regulator [Christensenellaceae bacterium]BDF61550.1 AbrB family transcriptional regulator [Christensenellaceae bacterium]
MPGMSMPKGRYMGTVKVGEKGQIVIPKTARDMFGIQSGDTLLLLADTNRGIAIIRNDTFMDLTDQILDVQGMPDDSPKDKE